MHVVISATDEDFTLDDYFMSDEYAIEREIDEAEAMLALDGLVSA